MTVFNCSCPFWNIVNIVKIYIFIMVSSIKKYKWFIYILVGLYLIVRDHSGTFIKYT